MSGETIGFIIGLLGVVIAAVTLFRSSRRDSQNDASENATMSAELRGDVKYIRNSIDDIKLEQRVMRTDISDLTARIIKCEADSKRANERLDEHIKNDKKEC